MAAVRSSRLVQKLPQLFVLVAIALGLLIVRNWAYVTTYRLYLSQRADVASRSAAAQRFDIEGSRVVPQIVSRDDDLIAFKTAIGRPSTLRVDVRPAGRAVYEIRWRDGSGSTTGTLARGEASAPLSLAVAIPAHDGFVEFASHGSLTWIDPRLIRDLRFAPHLVAIVLLLATALLLARFIGVPALPRPASTARIAWFRRIALAGSIAIG